MSLLMSKSLSFSLNRSGSYYHRLKNVRQASSCSTKRTTSTIQSHLPNIAPSCISMGGNEIPEKSFGQPTHLTHPHTIKEGELVPGIKREEFKDRRDKLVQNVRSFSSKNNNMKNSHIIVIPSSSKKYMTEAIPYIFRQNTDFLYLTGCLEPDSVLVIVSNGNGGQESILFLRGKDPHSELWDGPRTGIDAAVDFFGVDKSYAVSDFEPFISSLVKEHSDCTFWYDYIGAVHPDVHKSLRGILANFPSKVWESAKPIIHRLRLFKSPAEQELMKKSCEIASRAVQATIRNSKPWDNEAHIFARVDFECRMNGAEYLAYPPVVAGGNRANIIHYINNDQLVRDTDLVLMDAGCEYHGYTSDITRTWPIAGKFSAIQRVLYEIVLSVQLELIQTCCGFPSLDQLFSNMCKLLGRRLREAGVISSKVDDADIARVAYGFCPHHVSHYLGMDVHDTSSVPRNIPLKPGMVFTVEPGVYVSLKNKLANPEYRGHGIRIEDDILMTDNGPLVLTPCPKHPDDIEELFEKT